jgi:hypothetical protein
MPEKKKLFVILHFPRITIFPWKKCPKFILLFLDSPLCPSSSYHFHRSLPSLNENFIFYPTFLLFSTTELKHPVYYVLIQLLSMTRCTDILHLKMAYRIHYFLWPSVHFTASPLPQVLFCLFIFCQWHGWERMSCTQNLLSYLVHFIHIFMIKDFSYTAMIHVNFLKSFKVLYTFIRLK